MRKIVCVLLLLLLLTALALPALAVSGSVSIGVSAATLYRGDTFSVTATLNTADAIALGTVKLSYDTSALEMTGGVCHVPGTALGQVMPGQSAGTFMLSGEPALVSGLIFTFYFKVKDNAAFGYYPISSSASIGVDAGENISSGSTGVTVACRHSYENCTKADEANHTSTCPTCGDVKTEGHNWGNAAVITPATCKDPGVQKLTCAGCGATKEEPIPVTNNHSYGRWTESGSGHSHTCSVCGKTESYGHNWNNVTVLWRATCQQTGSQKLTCTACGASRTETIPITGHAFGACEFVDENTHKRTCADCGQEDTANHDYGGFAHDEKEHFKQCSGCGNKIENAAHTPGPKATETTNQVCTVCDRVLQPMGAHKHSFPEQWSGDEADHWHACTECMGKGDVAAHEYDDLCDADCNICGMTRQPEHEAPGAWMADETGHWFTCEACMQKSDVVAHVPGPEATIQSAQVCTVCGFEVAPKVVHDHNFAGGHTHVCECGEVYEGQNGDCPVCAPFPWWIVCIAEGVAFGGIIIWLLIRKKKEEG